MAGIEYVVLDFDGTCTQVDKIHEGFVADYGAEVGIEKRAWADLLARVTEASPAAGWTIKGTQSAPACADPFILCFEAAALWSRDHDNAPTKNVFEPVYERNEAPLRPELGDVLRALDAAKVKIGFISNTKTAKVAKRIDGIGLDADLRKRIHVTGGAEKYAICEPAFSANPAIVTPKRLAKFHALPVATEGIEEIVRPLYLRRGSYFEALCRFYCTFDDGKFPIGKTLVVGDIYELDLAMPQALGAKVHLIERANPFETYAYERAALKPKHVTADLTGVLKRL